jgi:hypothetical protein
MATTLYYTDTLSSLAIGSYVVRSMATTRGAGVVTKTRASLSGTVSSDVYDTGTTPLAFAYQVNAYSATTGTHTWNHWGSESNAMANGFAAGWARVYTNAGVLRFTILAFSSHASEYTTSPAAYNKSGAGTAQTVDDGDWIVFLPNQSFVSGATGYTVTFSYNGTSAAADGDAYITLADTVTAYTAAAEQVPYTNPMPQLLAQ